MTDNNFNPKADVGEGNSEAQPKVYTPFPKLADAEIVDSKPLATVNALGGTIAPVADETAKAELDIKRAPKALTRRARAFLELLIAGKGTLEAYELAGYKGEPHAAYQLRSDLRSHLTDMLESHGVSRQDVKIELRKLLQIPLDPASATFVTVEQKLKLLKFMDKLTETQQKDAPKITPFMVNIESPSKVEINEGTKQ